MTFGMIWDYNELTQIDEWHHDPYPGRQPQGEPEHVGFSRLVRDLSGLYREVSALPEIDYETGPA